jgi:fluoride exporter
LLNYPSVQSDFHPMLSKYLLIFIGSGVGGMLRFALSQWLQPWLTRFPWATMAANIIACLVLGMVLGTKPPSDPQRWLLGVGFCGGLSTFSSFVADTTQLNLGLAALNIILNLLVCFTAFGIGLKVGHFGQ